jgi:hypothetical protein
MPRHESVTDEYVAELQAGFVAEAGRVKAAPDWSETQRRMIGGTHPFLVATGRVNEGWTREEIANELTTRLTLGKMTTRVVGSETRE